MNSLLIGAESMTSVHWTNAATARDQAEGGWVGGASERDIIGSVGDGRNFAALLEKTCVSTGPNGTMSVTQ